MSYSKEEEEKLQELGNRLRELRKSNGLSQEEFANKSGLHRTYIGSVERGERNISFLNLCEIAKTLDISLSEVFRDDRFQVS